VLVGWDDMGAKQNINTKDMGKARTKFRLKDLQVELNGVILTQVEPHEDVTITYTWDSGCPATEFDPGYESVFETTRIILSRQAIFVDENHGANLRFFAHVDIVPYLSEKELQRIDALVEASLKQEAYDDFDEPEYELKMHKRYGVNTR